jgi:hypothetical protein
MTPEDDPHVERLSMGPLDELDDDYDEAPRSSMWWALHRPETYAVAALALAVIAMVGLAPQELEQALAYGQQGPKTFLGVGAGVRLGIAALAVLLAIMSIRTEDEDSGWSQPVARAALVVGAVAVALAAASLITVLTTTSDDLFRVAGLGLSTRSLMHD